MQAISGICQAFGLSFLPLADDNFAQTWRCCNWISQRYVTQGFVHTGVFSQQAAARDPQPCGVEDYSSALARLLTFPAPHFVVFTADRDSITGQPWCPDCARALPGLQRQVAEAGGTLLEVEV